ncbi:hypothetical protein [uncultured Jannaschia sp.]|uniref:hypothetical protein n=1 Tax=uncultured Jannaschia sp. TaxID=293347 RepID=UPI0026348F02|nr:hypothetical protein [uncultured Jannaschia sp.]
MRRVVSATDSEAAVSPDGIRIQAKGGIVQWLSRAIYEWGDLRPHHRYLDRLVELPMLPFERVPDTIDVHVIDPRTRCS